MLMLLPCVFLLLAGGAWAFEGFGAATPGGDNRPVVAVTSLADSGPGSLREALSGGERRIVFRVSGTIHLEHAIRLADAGFVTVDGSTAPDPGITLEGAGLYIRRAHDVVITHLRVRKTRGQGVDGITLRESHHVVIDHCSLTDASDENIGITEDSHDVTVSWCLFSHTLPESSAKGVLIANFDMAPVTRVSLHHNLFVNEAQRSPQISTAGVFDVRNNVIHEWKAYGMRFRNGAYGNVVRNVLRSQRRPEQALVIWPSAAAVYLLDNRGVDDASFDPKQLAGQPFPVAPVATDPVDTVERRVIHGAGAAPRDAVDRRIVSEALFRLVNR
jgi:pectate lyase